MTARKYLEMYLYQYLKGAPLTELSRPLPDKFFTSYNTRDSAIYTELPKIGINPTDLYGGSPVITPNGSVYLVRKDGLSNIHNDFPVYLEEKIKNIKSAGVVLAKLNDMKVNYQVSFKVH
jgi:hypothetical protein